MRHASRMGTLRHSVEGHPARSGLEALAARTEERAAGVRWHAAQARHEAWCDRTRGDHEAEQLHLSEAEAHERSARVIEQTAALYRRRIRRMTGFTPQPVRDEPGT
jgi:hypothetical protein